MIFPDFSNMMKLKNLSENVSYLWLNPLGQFCWVKSLDYDFVKFNQNVIVMLLQNSAAWSCK